MNRIWTPLISGALALGLVAGCAPSDTDEASGTQPAPAPVAPAPPPVVDAGERAVGDTFSIDSGRPGVAAIEAEVLAVGSGQPCGQGRRALIHYTGTFLDGKQFDSSRGGQPFPVNVGAGGVIPGWDIVAAKMRAGDRWKVHIPYQLAYGDRGHPAGIAPRTDLFFDMELIEIR